MSSNKRKFSKETNSQPESQAAVGEVVLNTKRLTKRPRPEELSNDDQRPDARPDTELRRSSRAGKGSGGSIQQLQHIERIQSARPSRQSTRSLDIATEGQEVNVMAPTHPTDAVYDDEESQVPPWAESFAPLTQVRPTFTLSQSSQYGFKLPSQTDGNTEHGTRLNTRGHGAVPLTSRRTLSSAPSSNSSRPSSRSASVFSTGVISRTGSQFTPASSRAPSECGISDEYGIAPNDIDTSQRILRTSQLRMLATVASQPSSAPASHECSSSAPRVEDQGSADAMPDSPPLRPAGLRRTRSYLQLPSSLPRAHTILMSDAGVGGEEDFNGNANAIDELSPDEDERIAESVIRNDINRAPVQRSENTTASTVSSNHGSITPNSQKASRPAAPRGDVEDVVAQYHQRNRPPRLPNHRELMAIRSQQESQRSRSVSRANSTADDADELEAPISQDPRIALLSTGANSPANSPANTPLQSVIRSATPGAHNLDPSQLHFYAPAVRDIIERAKQFSHCDLASINSFPVRPQFIAKASEYINEAIVERRECGLAIPEGWWPQHTSDITKLLWEDIGNWRSSLKKKARNFVRERYQWDPQNRRSVNADIAKALLVGGTFLKDGRDEEGHTNNLAHPALAGLVVEFFYTSANTVGSLFPEVFANEVPRAAVSLAATAIKLALDEVAAEGKEVMFKRDVYADVYVDIMGLMVKCDTTPIHRAKTKALRVHWAKIGRNGGTAATSTGFDVDLD